MAFVTDNFGGTTGIDLSAHTSVEDATTWTEHGSYTTGSILISNSNRARSGASPQALYYSSGTPTGAEYDIEGTVTVRSTGAGLNCGVAARIATGADTYYRAFYDNQVGWEIVKVVAGTPTSLGTFAHVIADETTVAFKFEVRDSAKKLYVEGVERISTADNAITDGGRVGVWAVGTSGNTAGTHLDAFVATDFASAATHLEFDEQPTDTPYDTVIDPPVTVLALTDAEAVDTSYEEDVTIAIEDNPGTGVLSGTLTVAAVAGVATFDDLTIDEVGALYTLVASDGVLTDTPESDTFDILDQVADHLAFDQHPANVEEDTVFTLDITVEALQPDLQVDTSYTGDITLAIGTNPSGGVLSGTVTQAAVAGVATFDDLEIDKPGTGYTLVATGAGLTLDTSDAFNVTQEAAVELDYLVEPVDTQVNTIIAPPIRVRALDSEGDVDTNYVANVVLSKFSGPGTITGTLTQAAVAGVATFDDIEGDAAGAYVLRATSGALPTEDSVAFALSDTPPSEQDIGADVLMGGWPGRMRLG